MAGRVRPLSLFYSDASADGVEERSLVPRCRSYTRLRLNATMRILFPRGQRPRPAAGQRTFPGRSSVRTPVPRPSPTRSCAEALCPAISSIIVSYPRFGIPTSMLHSSVTKGDAFKRGSTEFDSIHGEIGQLPTKLHAPCHRQLIKPSSLDIVTTFVTPCKIRGRSPTI
ncbi:hypothetical protein EVAR_94292_1 [Eumeta japonica]|uniref:Uncharacterized protein n=1 Tax=Eumeta variegata TaxID=151549 RepID=A0A4C1UF29_EUMVA|nr:hypothetical protein EVAR_94292_1 [Eumeta japonica]